MLLLCSCAWFPPLAEIQRRPSPAKPDQVARAEERLKERETERKQGEKKKGTELEEKKGERESEKKKAKNRHTPKEAKRGSLSLTLENRSWPVFFLGAGRLTLSRSRDGFLDSSPTPRAARAARLQDVFPKEKKAHPTAHRNTRTRLFRFAVPRQSPAVLRARRRTKLFLLCPRAQHPIGFRSRSSAGVESAAATADQRSGLVRLRFLDGILAVCFGLRRAQFEQR